MCFEDCGVFDGVVSEFLVLKMFFLKLKELLMVMLMLSSFVSSA